MDLILKRKLWLQAGIFGMLYSGDEQIAVTLEHAFEISDAVFRPIIPQGIYACQRGSHRLNGMDQDFETFEILGIAGHSGLLFHAGNFNKDSEGCVLLGDEMMGLMITNSRATFAKFMALQVGVSQFQLSVL